MIFQFCYPVYCIPYPDFPFRFEWNSHNGNCQQILLLCMLLQLQVLHLYLYLHPFLL